MSSSKQEQFLDKLSRRVATMRKDHHFTQEQLAEAAGIDRVALAAIETGKRRPTVTTLFKLSVALKIEVKDFFVGL